MKSFFSLIWNDSFIEVKHNALKSICNDMPRYVQGEYVQEDVDNFQAWCSNRNGDLTCKSFMKT